ncbi:hypothetical protein JI742_08265 [Piscinibacter sp. Jin2]|uniref:Uncharacterized protein n=1 Tax=Aquariibacter lacus TaxID=2801332 RepID=A0A9X1BNH5_9BURK|nr:hypothetical protein [Piscinibacter lacus]MBL0719882.1 hypothetical protein [Piscinibacter lacus]
MDAQTLIIALAVAAVVFFFLRRGKGGSAEPAASPVMAAPAAPVATRSTLGDVQAYRKAHPSNQIQGKLTCHHCGSNRVGCSGSCENCGAQLFSA